MAKRHPNFIGHSGKTRLYLCRGSMGNAGASITSPNHNWEIRYGSSDAHRASGFLAVDYALTHPDMLPAEVKAEIRKRIKG